MEKEILEKFLSINEQNCNPTIGKYSSKKETFFEDLEKWQKERRNKENIIKPIQFTFEITNRCNCNCKDCGMSANSVKVGKTKLSEEEIYKLVVEIFNKNYKKDPIRLIGVRLSDLSETKERQLTLFEEQDKDQEKEEEIQKTIDDINQKFGKSIVAPASLKIIGNPKSKRNLKD